MHPDISIVIVNWNTRELTLACLESLCAALEAYRSEVWVVDNASHDGSVAAIRAAYPQVKLIENNQNVGFAAANNQALQQANGRYLFLLNSDTLCKAGALSRLIHYADQHPQIAMLGPKLLNADGSFQPSFADFPNFANELLSVSGIGARIFGAGYPGYAEQHAQQARRVDYLAGAAMLLRREWIERVGLMDEAYFMYSEETDWCYRIQQAGGQIWYLPDAQITHLGGQSTKQIRYEMQRALYRSKVRFFHKHYGALAAQILRITFVGILGLKWLIRQALRPKTPVNRISWRDLQTTI